MSDSIPKRYELRAELFKVLGHPMRLLILDKLKERPRCVCELATELAIGKSMASKHLSALKSVGLIDDEKHGTLVEYRILVPCILELGDCAEAAVLDHARKRLAG